MATKILIPTPLRPFTDRKDAVEVDGKTVGELRVILTDVTNKPRYSGMFEVRHRFVPAICRTKFG